MIPDPSHCVALWTFVAEQRQEWECIGGDGKQRKEATFWSQISFISALNGHETTSAFIQVKKKKKSAGHEHHWDVKTSGQKYKWSIPSLPWRHCYQRICSRTCYTEGAGTPMLHITFFVSCSSLMLPLYMHYTAPPLHKVKPSLQADPRLHCLAVKALKVHVGSFGAKLLTMDFAM